MAAPAWRTIWQRSRGSPSVEIVEGARAVDHDAAIAAVAHEQVRAQAEKEVGHPRVSAGAHDAHELVLGRGRDEQVRGATDLEGGVRAHRLVAAHGVRTHDALQGMGEGIQSFSVL